MATKRRVFHFNFLRARKFANGKKRFIRKSLGKSGIENLFIYLFFFFDTDIGRLVAGTFVRRTVVYMRQFRLARVRDNNYTIIDKSYYAIINFFFFKRYRKKKEKNSTEFTPPSILPLFFNYLSSILSAVTKNGDFFRF